MGESTCLMQPFSYASGIPNEAKEGNPIHVLGQSVSFGRFMSESLSWEKWSTFSSNRYVEEAERYSRPGSVAQKKAFFDAHYKNLAARKAAALLEQANAASNDALPAEAGEDSENLIPQVGFHEQEVTAPTTETKLTHDADKVEKIQKGVTNGMKDESLGNLEDVDDAETGQLQLNEPNRLESSETSEPRKVLKELELSETSPTEKPPLKHLISNEAGFETMSEKRQAASFSKQPVYAKVSKLLPSSSPAKKENHATPNRKKPTADAADRKRSTPKASHRSISFTPAKEFNKLTATIMRKMDGSRASSNTRAAKDCSTPLRTPTTGQAATSGRSKHPLATPWSETKSVRNPFDSSASVSKSIRGKWNFLKTDANRNISQSPSIFASFTLRTEERAVRRKQKLEEKFNSTQARKVQHHATLRAKAGTELKKLNPSFCFKARPLPDFYKERSAKNTKEEVSVEHPESATSGKNPIPSRESTLQREISIPRQRSSNKNFGFKRFPESKNQISAGS